MRISRTLEPSKMEREPKQVRITKTEYKLRKCPFCGADLEIIEGHWLLRDCALCAWCRRWFALPEGDNSGVVSSIKSTTGTRVIVEPMVSKAKPSDDLKNKN
jgi:hypothetical protein